MSVYDLAGIVGLVIQKKWRLHQLQKINKNNMIIKKNWTEDIYKGIIFIHVIIDNQYWYFFQLFLHSFARIISAYSNNKGEGTGLERRGGQGEWEALNNRGRGEAFNNGAWFNCLFPELIQQRARQRRQRTLLNWNKKRFARLNYFMMKIKGWQRRR